MKKKWYQRTYEFSIWGLLAYGLFVLAFNAFMNWLIK